MSLDVTFTRWDLVLVVTVTLQATVLAYLYDPRWKAFVLSLPIPFTFAVLAVGRPVDTTNVLGLTLLLAFTHAVRVLHAGLQVSIVPSIAASALGYCALGTLIAPLIPPHNEALFWTTAVLTMAAGWIIYRLTPARAERGHRSPLPVWIKLPVVAAVVLGLVFIKKSLHGFMTVFPMVGVVATYEARHSLWTISRQIPVIMLSLTPMQMAVHLAQAYVGVGWALVLGWMAFFLTVLPFTREIMLTAGPSDDPAGELMHADAEPCASRNQDPARPGISSS